MGARERFTRGAAIDSPPTQHSLLKQTLGPRRKVRGLASHQTTRDIPNRLGKARVNEAELKGIAMSCFGMFLTLSSQVCDAQQFICASSLNYPH